MYTRSMQDQNLSPASLFPVIAGTAPARRRVLDYIREAILSGSLPGGTFLEEERVSAAVGVSRTPVREAFQQLHGEGLIELLPRRGARVRVVTAGELVEICEARLVLENFAIATLCRHRLPPPEAMRTAQAAMQRVAPADMRGHVRLNTEFHRALVAGAGNEVVTGLYDTLSARQDLVAMAAVSLDPARLAIINREHIALIAALERHDQTHAETILAVHLRPVADILAHLPAAAAEYPPAAARFQAK